MHGHRNIKLVLKCVRVSNNCVGVLVVIVLVFTAFYGFYCVFVLFCLCTFYPFLFFVYQCKDYCHRVTTELQLVNNNNWRWAGHVARMGEARGCIGSCWGNRREGDHWVDLGVDGWIILGWISRRWDVGIWTG